MSEPFVGQVIAVGFNFVPQGWLACNGQLLSIAEYEVLFNLLGTTYGGDGQTTFAVPDLRGRTLLSIGTGPGLSPHVLGEVSGAESINLTASQVGSHTHPLMASNKVGSASVPTGALVLGQGEASEVNVYGRAPSNTALNPPSIGLAGGSIPHENRQPFLVVNYIIAAFGIFPSQG